jgi:soluble lytic murein transglycosylase-like protein
MATMPIAPPTWDGLFWLAAVRYAGGTGLDPASFAALLKAHAQVESSFNPAAFRQESGGRASRGLMQVLDTTARRLGYTGPLGNDTTHVGGLYDPAVEIPLAAQLVRENLQGANGAVNVAIAAYNEGLPRALVDFTGGAPWRTTDAQYVSKVRAALADYLPYFVGQSDTGGLGLWLRGAL